MTGRSLTRGVGGTRFTSDTNCRSGTLTSYVIHKLNKFVLRDRGLKTRRGRVDRVPGGGKKIRDFSEHDSSELTLNNCCHYGVIIGPRVL